MLEISAAIGSLRASFDLLKGAVAARDDVKMQAALGDMGSRLVEALVRSLDGHTLTCREVSAHMILLELRSVPTVRPGRGGFY